MHISTLEVARDLLKDYRRLMLENVDDNRPVIEEIDVVLLSLPQGNSSDELQQRILSEFEILCTQVSRAIVDRQYAELPEALLRASKTIQKAKR